MNLKPCYLCEDRKPGCHGVCEKYQVVKRHNEAKNKAHREEQQSSADFVHRQGGRYR